MSQAFLKAQNDCLRVTVKGEEIGGFANEVQRHASVVQKAYYHTRVYHLWIIVPLKIDDFLPEIAISC